MTIKTTSHQRQQMYRAQLRGESYATTATAHGVSKECVRYWCRRQRDGNPVKTKWHQPKRGALSQFAPIVRYVILRLRLAHPRWGPDVIFVHLQKRPALVGKQLPSRSSIGRYLHQWPRFQRKRKPRSSKAEYQPHKPTRVHERWQIDFKLGIELCDGSQVNLHTVCDPVSGACITAQLTDSIQAPIRPKRVTIGELQTTIRTACALWQTLPESIQTDNEPVFVGHTDDSFPGRFTLWLIGLGIRHHCIRPGKPTDTAQVERNHQTVCNYAIVGNEQLSKGQLQAVLNQSVQELGHQIPSRAAHCQKQPPIQAYPELIAQPRPWGPELELARFAMARVDAFLASFAWVRRVSKTGQICIGGHHHYYSVGRQYARQDVYVCFDPEDRSFVFFQWNDRDPSFVGPELERRPARHLSFHEIAGISDPDCCIGPQQLSFSFPEPSEG